MSDDIRKCELQSVARWRWWPRTTQEDPVSIMSGEGSNDCRMLRVSGRRVGSGAVSAVVLQQPAAACSIASADCSCRVSGPPAQPGFYEVRITQHKNIIHIGRRARPRQCGCGGWRAASCGWPGFLHLTIEKVSSSRSIVTKY